MRVISRAKLVDCWEQYPLAESPLTEWFKITRRASWRTFADVRAMFNSADLVGNCVVFDIGGNKFRLIAAIYYQKQKNDGDWTLGKVFVRKVLSHAEYDKGKWKDDCGAK